MGNANSKFPTHCFSPRQRNAIDIFAKITQAPIELICSILLAVMSLAIQSFCNVRFPDGRIKPLALYILALADSGERKTSLISLIARAIFDYEKYELEKYEEALTYYNTQKKARNVIRKALAKKLQVRVEKGLSYDNEMRALENFEEEEQSLLPRKFKFTYSDATPEAIQWGLYKHIPSAGMMIDEGSVFFEGRAKNGLGFFNKAWDGGTIDVTRRVGESFSVHNVKITMLLMVQNDIFTQYCEREMKRSMGMGFLPRFLITRPESMQGQRNFKYRPLSSDDDKILVAFNDQITKYLKQSHETIFGIQDIQEITLSEGAEKILDEKQLTLEKLILGKKEYCPSSQAFISKAPENIVRLAGLLSIFDENSGHVISEEHMKNATEIVKYYLNQTEEIFTTTYGTLENDIDNLHRWCFSPDSNGKLRIGFVKSEFINYIPNYLRKKGQKRVDEIIKVLIEKRIVTIVSAPNKYGKPIEYIQINHQF